MITSHERFARMFADKVAEMIPIIDGPCADTVARWQREGMHAEVRHLVCLRLDKVARMGGNCEP